MLVAGLLAVGAGVCIYLWPWILNWAVAGCFVLLGAGLVISALAARTGGAEAQRPPHLDATAGD